MEKSRSSLTEVNAMVDALKRAGKVLLAHGNAALVDGNPRVAKHFHEEAESCFRALPKNEFDVIGEWRADGKE